MSIPQHNPAVFYSGATEGEVRLSVGGFLLLVVLPLVVLGLVMWWASRKR